MFRKSKTDIDSFSFRFVVRLNNIKDNIIIVFGIISFAFDKLKERLKGLKTIFNDFFTNTSVGSAIAVVSDFVFQSIKASGNLAKGFVGYILRKLGVIKETTDGTKRKNLSKQLDEATGKNSGVLFRGSIFNRSSEKGRVNDVRSQLRIDKGLEKISKRVGKTTQAINDYAFLVNQKIAPGINEEEFGKIKDLAKKYSSEVSFASNLLAKDINSIKQIIDLKKGKVGVTYQGILSGEKDLNQKKRLPEFNRRSLNDLNNTLNQLTRRYEGLTQLQRKISFSLSSTGGLDVSSATKATANNEFLGVPFKTFEQSLQESKERVKKLLESTKKDVNPEDLIPENTKDFTGKGNDVKKIEALFAKVDIFSERLKSSFEGIATSISSSVGSAMSELILQGGKFSDVINQIGANLVNNVLSKLIEQVTLEGILLLFKKKQKAEAVQTSTISSSQIPTLLAQSQLERNIMIAKSLQSQSSKASLVTDFIGQKNKQSSLASEATSLAIKKGSLTATLIQTTAEGVQGIQRDAQNAKDVAFEGKKTALWSLRNPIVALTAGVAAFAAIGALTTRKLANGGSFEGGGTFRTPSTFTAGERGEEAVLPLARTKTGALGVTGNIGQEESGSKNVEINYAPNITVNVTGNNADNDSIVENIKYTVKEEFNKMLQENLRPGGALNRGI